MILDGKVVAQKIENELKKEIIALKAKGIIPSIAVILVGDDPASLTYVRAKEKKAETLGIDFRLFHFAGNARQNQVLELISELNQNHRSHGTVVQLPLPDDFDSEKIITQIAPEKDIDGLTGKIAPPAVLAILEILKFYQIKLEGNIVLVGHGQLVGQPLEKILISKSLKPIICDSSTKDLQAKLSEADIIISATGVPGLITSEMVKEGVVVIDAGTAESGGAVKGDFDEKVYPKTRAYSPVPGGIGPVTVMMLMKNLVEAAKHL